MHFSSIKAFSVESRYIQAGSVSDHISHPRNLLEHKTALYWEGEKAEVSAALLRLCGAFITPRPALLNCMFCLSASGLLGLLNTCT